VQSLVLFYIIKWFSYTVCVQNIYTAVYWVKTTCSAFH